MYWKSLLLIMLTVGLVFLISYSIKRDALDALPSSYDSGLNLADAVEAAQQASHSMPLLIEFYSDTCAKCRVMTPVLHRVHGQRFATHMPLVMVNTDDEPNRLFINLFDVDEIPALFLFEPKRMKRHRIELQSIDSTPALCNAIAQAYANTDAGSKAARISCEG